VLNSSIHLRSPRASVTFPSTPIAGFDLQSGGAVFLRNPNMVAPLLISSISLWVPSSSAGNRSHYGDGIEFLSVAWDAFWAEWRQRPWPRLIDQPSHFVHTARPTMTRLQRCGRA